ncbi:hypothetical protein WJX72_005109 [[Myrmecia] bisecta]|uniref:Protein kinase domain-containing protein n=1 Tax=[Myrmecia] bisecta TaxID=41462 RepID=A0AAW1PJX8_9CHLO
MDKRMHALNGGQFADSFSPFEPQPREDGSVHSKPKPIELPDIGLKDTHKLIQFLGRGGTGNTYEYKDLETGQAVAIKLIARPIPKVIMPNIFREIRIQAELGEGHVSIINAKEAILTESHLALVMECAHGGSLTNYVSDRVGRARETGLVLTEEEARFFFRQFLSAVEYCHARNVAHRDLKLDNTLLDGSDPPMIKLCDFGFAKNWQGEDNNMYTVIGTPVYMSPELIHSRNDTKGYDAQSVDVWAGGVLLIVMLVGRFPFDHLDHPNPQTYEAHMEIWQQQSRSRWAEIPHMKHAVERLSAECIDLLDKIFVTDEKKRITLQQIKEHPWVMRPQPPLYAKAEEKFVKEQARVEEFVGRRTLSLAAIRQRAEDLQQMVEAAGARPPEGGATMTVPIKRLNLTEESVVQPAEGEDSNNGLGGSPAAASFEPQAGGSFQQG